MESEIAISCNDSVDNFKLFSKFHFAGETLKVSISLRVPS